jgi:hypothetical protein
MYNVIDHLRELDVGGRIILNIYRKEAEYDQVDWIHLTQGMVEWRALVKIAVDLRFP